MQEKRKQLRFESNGMLSSIINNIVKKNIEEKKLSYDGYQAVRTRSNTARRELEDDLRSSSAQKLQEYFTEIIKNSNIVIKVAGTGSIYGRSNYPKDVYLKPVSIELNDINYNYGREPLDRNKLRMICTSSAFRMVYNEIIISDNDMITLAPESYNGDVVSGTELEIFNLLRPGYICFNELKFIIEGLESSLKRKEDEVTNIKTKIENNKYIYDFMKVNNINYDKSSTIKSKILLEMIKNEDNNDDIILTNLNEIIDLSL